MPTYRFSVSVFLSFFFLFLVAVDRLRAATALLWRWDTAFLEEGHVHDLWHNRCLPQTGSVECGMGVTCTTGEADVMCNRGASFGYPQH